MPKIKRTDPAACSVPKLGHFEQGDELPVSDELAKQFRNTTGWEVLEDPAKRVKKKLRDHPLPPDGKTTTPETPEEGEGE